MTTTVNSHVSIRLFLGAPLQAELKANLQQSSEWRATTITSSAKAPLIVVWFQGKEYLGRYLSNPEHTLSELKQESALVSKEIEGLCPKMTLEALPLLVFPQIFIS